MITQTCEQKKNRSRRDNGQGMFRMQVIKQVEAMADLTAAKRFLMVFIQEAESVRDYNREKARQMVENATSMKHLLIGMANFMLAHSGLQM